MDINIIDFICKKIKTIFIICGAFGPIILFFTSIYILWLEKRESYIYYYIIGFVFNSLINIFLKAVIQQPRPGIDMDAHIFEQRLKTKLKMKNGIPFNLFGMPSGHAQAVAYSITYIALASIFSDDFLSMIRKKNWIIRNALWIYSILLIITCIQRVISNEHTPFQVLCGLIVGIGIGYATFYFTKQKIKTIPREKPDDNCFIGGTHPL